MTLPSKAEAVFYSSTLYGTSLIFVSQVNLVIRQGPELTEFIDP